MFTRGSFSASSMAYVSVTTLICAVFAAVLNSGDVECISLDKLAVERNELVQDSAVVVDSMAPAVMPTNGDTNMYVLLPLASKGLDRNTLEEADMEAAQTAGDMLMMETNDSPMTAVALQPEKLAEEGNENLLHGTPEVLEDPERNLIPEQLEDGTSYTPIPIALKLAELLQQQAGDETESKISDENADIVEGERKESVEETYKKQPEIEIKQNEEVQVDPANSSNVLIVEDTKPVADRIAAAIKDIVTSVKSENEAMVSSVGLKPERDQNSESFIDIGSFIETKDPVEFAQEENATKSEDDDETEDGIMEEVMDEVLDTFSDALAEDQIGDASATGDNSKISASVSDIREDKNEVQMNVQQQQSLASESSEVEPGNTGSVPVSNDYNQESGAASAEDTKTEPLGTMEDTEYVPKESDNRSENSETLNEEKFKNEGLFQKEGTEEEKEIVDVMKEDKEKPLSIEEFEALKVDQQEIVEQDKDDVNEQILGEEIKDEAVINQHITSDQIVDEQSDDKEVLVEESVNEKVLHEENIEKPKESGYEQQKQQMDYTEAEDKPKYELEMEQGEEQQHAIQQTEIESTVHEEINLEELQKDNQHQNEPILEGPKDETSISQEVTESSILHNGEIELNHEENSFLIVDKDSTSNHDEIAIANNEIATANDGTAIANDEIAIANDGITIANDEIAIAKEEIPNANDKITIANDEMINSNGEMQYLSEREQNQEIQSEELDKVFEQVEMIEPGRESMKDRDEVHKETDDAHEQVDEVAVNTEFTKKKETLDIHLNDEVAQIDEDKTQEIAEVPQKIETSSILTTILQVPQQQQQLTNMETKPIQDKFKEMLTKVESEEVKPYMQIQETQPQPATQQPQQQQQQQMAIESDTSKPVNVMNSVLNYVNASFIRKPSYNVNDNNNTNNNYSKYTPSPLTSDYSSKLRRYDGAQVWRIVVQNDKDRRMADELQTKYDGQLWKEVKSEVDYLLKPQVLADAEKHVRRANLSRIVLIDNLQKIIEVENPPTEEIEELQNRKGHRMTWRAYHRLADIHGFFDYLAKTYPDICSVETIGYSLEKRPLKILKVSDGNLGNPGIWIDGGMHAREWISPASVTYIANQLVEGWDDLPAYMRNVNWYIHAVANPDGYEYSHTTDRLWRKNMRSHGRQCPGVDLNRNFGFKWGGKGTSANPCSQTYRGSKAFSEPETFYISKFISNFPRGTFQAYLSFHSYGQYILYPWGYDYQVSADRADLDLVARQAGSIITKSSGVKYTVGSSALTLYPAAGGSDDWAKGIAGIKYSYTIEMGDTGQYGFVLPASMIENNGKDAFSFVETVARAVTQQGKESRKHVF